MQNPEPDRKRKRQNWTSWLPFIIFLALAFRGPISQFLQSLGGTTFAFSPPPWAIGLLLAVLVLVIATASRAFGQSVNPPGRQPGLPPPQSLPRQTSRPQAPDMPPSAPPVVLEPGGFSSETIRNTTVRRAEQRLPPAPLPPATALDLQTGKLRGGRPQFEPVIDPGVLGCGLLALIMLGGLGLGLFLLLAALP